MNYLLKYLKYKEKYLKLKNQKGGTKLNLSGPVSIHYFINEDMNKKIIILGDYHRAGKDGICEPEEENHNLFIEKYLEKFGV